MLGAIKYGFTNLLNFGGRDARTTFWYFVLILYLAETLISVIAIAPSYVGMMGQVIRTSVNNPGDVQAANAVMASSMGNMMDSMLWLGVITALLLVVMLAASLVRRLHDSDLSGYWAMIPGGFQLLAPALMPGYIDGTKRMMADMYGPDPLVSMHSFSHIFSPVMFIGWIPWIAVIVIGLRKSTPGPNRYGETPVYFR